MTKNLLKRFLSFIMTICILTGIFPVISSPAFAADTENITVDIVSFMRGPQANLRASELLEARVSGYDGNVQELTYEWTNNLGTYLYVYNSHNMYYINGTDGEIEIYNNNVSSSANMSGHSYKYSYENKGFCWAAVYGAYNSAYQALDGSITVVVKDKDGNELCRDTHTADAKRTGFLQYSYSGIIPYTLESDLDDVTIGMFEGDKRNVKDLLGESAILHITCVESNVNNGYIVSGGSNISLTTENGDYYITGTKAGSSASTSKTGDAQVNLTISKSNCKFHRRASGTATTTVFVFRKPTTATTAYTLSLTGNLDSRCEYFIEGKQGTVQDDGTILFTGLNPNTQYMVEVRAKYTDENNNERYTYAYVYDTTLPIYTGTVEVYLDGTYDSATHTATGTKVNIEDVSEYNTIFAKEENSSEYTELKHQSTGTYSSVLDSGSYKLYYTEDESTKIDDQTLTMHHADRTRYLFYNSVVYKDGDTVLNTEYHCSDSSVNVYNTVPVKADYAFVGWKDQDGNIYQPSQLLTSNIGKPYILTAQWVEGIDVYVNISIDHYAKNNGGHNAEADRHNVDFDLMFRHSNGATGDYADVFETPYSITWNGTDEFESKHFEATHAFVPDKSDNTYYTAKAPVLVNTPIGNEYSIEVAKSGYEITDVKTTTAENGDVTVDVALRYDPKNADLTFTVELDEKSKALVEKHPEYKPQAVHVKVLSWYTSEYQGAEHVLEKNEWHHITQHHDTFVTLTLDENGQATGSYPVWMHNSKKTEYYYYRIKVVSYVLSNGTIINTQDVENKKNVEYLTADDRYLATISVENGAVPENSYLMGAHFMNDSGTQQGTVKATIHINTYNVTFMPNGGTLENSTDNKTLTEQIEVPQLDNYIPTRDDGYVFVGWYLYENGVITNKTVNSGDDLFNDITLIAKWKEPLTVQGIISVAGYYHFDNNTEDVRVINNYDRTHYVTVYLQKILPNGYTETIDSQKVSVVYNDQSLDDVERPMGTANYQFKKIPDDGHNYRVLIQNPNYVDKYQNEPDSLDFNKKFDYTNHYYDEEKATSFMAEFGSTDPLVADVNVFMEFVPHTFDLDYRVDATTIGDGFRPSNAEVLILYDDNQHGEHAQDWPVITQMIKDDVVTGQSTKLSDSGIGDNSYPVWTNTPDGHTLYSYSVLLKDYTYNVEEVAFNADTAPFYAYYNGSARFSAIQEQTQLLTINLVPRRYTITFDIGFSENENDYVTNMDPYEDENLVYTKRHIWSFDTDISDVVPVREGYKFLGWYDKDDNLLTKVDASIASDITVYGKWKKGFSVTFHANNDSVNYDVFRTYYENDIELPSGDNVYKLNQNNRISAFYDIPEFEYTTHNKYIFKGWYLDKDNDNDTRPISFDTSYDSDTDIYAHWIDTKTVSKEEADTKLTEYGIEYPGYDLIGVQIRDIDKDNLGHFGNASSGLRFVTVLSEDVYSQVNNVNSKNASGAEYGYALAKTNTAKNYAADTVGYELQYKGKNVNGVDTTTTYKYVSNVKCSGVADHYNGEAYRLYTAVVTFNKVGDALSEAHAAPLLARSYIRYYDANNLQRTHYNNYTGTNVFSGCSASFDDALSLMTQKAE